MSLIVLLIVVQFIFVAGFIASAALLFVGIIAGLKPPKRDSTDLVAATVDGTAALTSGWRIVESFPETTTG